jgi:hypothetical protein
MDKRTLFRVTALAALIALMGVLGQLAALSGIPTDVQLQPSIPLPVDDFLRGSREFPSQSLMFFASDSVFVMGYVLVFAGLYVVTAERARIFAKLALGLGIATAAFDTLENTVFISYSLGANAGFTLDNAALPLIFIVTNLKWLAAFGTMLTFGLIFPRRDSLSWVISGLMVVFTVVGVAGIVFPNLIAWRGLFFLIGMPLFAWFFWQGSKKTGITEGVPKGLKETTDA